MTMRARRSGVVPAFWKSPSLTGTPWDWVNTKAQGAFPGTEGYAATSCTHARDAVAAQVLFVTNCNDSGAGSFRAAYEQSFPRFILFKTSGNIALENFVSDELYAGNCYIAGQTAPSPGIAFVTGIAQTRNWGLVARQSNIVVQHLRFRPSHFTPDGANGTNIQALGITGTETDLIIDHCSCSWNGDENITGVRRRWDVVDCIGSESMMLSPTGGGGQNLGISYATDSHSVIRGIYAHDFDRTPTASLNSGDRVSIINPLIYNHARSFLGAFGHTFNTDGVTRCNWLSYRIIDGPNKDSQPTSPPDRYYCVLNTGTAAGSTWYDTDDHVLDPGNTWGPHDVRSANWTRVFSPDPALPASVTVRAASTVEARALLDSGARPLDRDATDLRIVSEITNRTGTIRTGATRPAGEPENLAQNFYDHETDAHWIALGLDNPANRFLKDIHPFYSRIELYNAKWTAQVQDVSLIPNV